MSAAEFGLDSSAEKPGRNFNVVADHTDGDDTFRAIKPNCPRTSPVLHASHAEGFATICDFRSGGCRLSLAGIFVRNWNHTIFREGIFFSKAAVVTFGGAYAVLPLRIAAGSGKLSLVRPGSDA